MTWGALKSTQRISHKEGRNDSKCLVSREISNTIVLGQEWTSAQSKAGALEAEHKPLGIRLMEGEQKKKK
jgi:hypothetical protein